MYREDENEGMGLGQMAGIGAGIAAGGTALAGLTPWGKPIRQGIRSAAGFMDKSPIPGTGMLGTGMNRTAAFADGVSDSLEGFGGQVAQKVRGMRDAAPGITERTKHGLLEAAPKVPTNLGMAVGTGARNVIKSTAEALKGFKTGLTQGAGRKQAHKLAKAFADHANTEGSDLFTALAEAGGGVAAQSKYTDELYKHLVEAGHRIGIAPERFATEMGKRIRQATKERGGKFRPSDATKAVETIINRYVRD